MTLQDLNAHFILRQELNEAEEMLANLEAKAGPRAQALDGLPRAPGVRDTVGTLAIAIADLKDSIAELTDQVSRSETEIERFICTIADNRLRCIFRLRFLQGLAWKEVAFMMGRYATEAAVKAECYRYLRKE